MFGRMVGSVPGAHKCFLWRLFDSLDRTLQTSISITMAPSTTQTGPTTDSKPKQSDGCIGSFCYSCEKRMFLGLIVRLFVSTEPTSEDFEGRWNGLFYSVTVRNFNQFVELTQDKYQHQSVRKIHHVL